MYYITTLKLNTRNDILRDPSILHTYIAQALHIPVKVGPQSIGEDRRYLWRIDTAEPIRIFSEHKNRTSEAILPTQGRKLVIVSDAIPNMNNLITKCGDSTIPYDRVSVTKVYDGIMDEYTIDKIYNFRLVANPTKTIHDPNNTHGRGTVHGINNRVEQIAWLRRQGEKYGFNVLFGARLEYTTIRLFDGRDYKTKTAHPYTFNPHKVKPTNHPTGMIQFRTCTFTGKLVITDMEKFRTALVNGIGPCKAYGQGLLTISSEESEQVQK